MAPASTLPGGSPAALSSSGVSKTTQGRSQAQERAEETEQLLRAAVDEVLQFMRKGALPETEVCPWGSNQDARESIAMELPAKGLGATALPAHFHQALNSSINPYTGRFLDKLYTAPHPVGLAAELLLSAINANSHVFSASPFLCLAEERCVAGLASLCGWGSSAPDANPETQPDGLTMPGGSASNTLAIQTAMCNVFASSFRQGGLLGVFRELQRQGVSSGRPLIYTSEQSHYSIEKAALGCGFGLDSVVKVPCDDEGRMDPEALDNLLKKAFADGSVGRPFFVNATSGSTVLGSFDNLKRCAEVCAAQPSKVWLHVDGSWGGPVLFSSRWRKLMDGIELADSLAINPHKLLNTPLQCSFALFRNGSVLDSNSLNADYLFHGNGSQSDGSKPRRLHAARRENPATMAYGCGRRGDAFKLYLAWLRYGTEGLGAHVDAGFDKAAWTRDLLAAKHSDTLELGPKPDPLFLQVCFRPRPPQVLVSGKSDEERAKIASSATHHVYSTLRERRRFAVDFAPLPRGVGDFIRLVTHPIASHEDLAELASEVASIGAEFWAAQSGKA